MCIRDSLELMARIREVEALVAQRKIRDEVARHRAGERRPVVKRRVDDFVTSNAAVGVRHCDVRDLAAPSLLERDDELRWLERATLDAQRTCLLYTSDAADERSSVDLG